MVCGRRLGCDGAERNRALSVAELLLVSSQAIQQKAICVTCNYEARDFGVHKLQRIADAKRLCPRLVLVSGEDLTPFRAVSEAVFELIRSAFTPHVQRLGMDEVFLDVSDAVDSLEAGCPFEPSALPSLPWAGFVYAGPLHAKATVERQVPLAALAHGWSSGRGALAALAAAAGNAGALGDAGTSVGTIGSEAARTAEPAWSRYARAPPGSATASEAPTSGPEDPEGRAPAISGAASPGAASPGATRELSATREDDDPEPSDAVPCPDASARWAPTPVTLVPVGAAPGRAEHRLRLASALAARIRFAVASRLGIRCCAGVGASKLAAKFAVNLRKPASQSVLLPSGMSSFLASLRVQALPGVGHTATKRLRALAGVETVPQLLVAPRALVEEALGSEGLAARALSLARGLDDDPVKASGPPRTISDEDSFRSLRGVERASAELRRIAADLLPRLDADAGHFGRRPRALRVALRTDRERRQTRQQPFPDAALSAHVCSGAELARRRAAGALAAARGEGAAEESAAAQDSRTAGQRSAVLAEAAERLALAAGLTDGVRITLLSVGAGNFSQASRGVDSLGGQAAAGSLGSGAALTMERFLAQPVLAAASPLGAAAVPPQAAGEAASARECPVVPPSPAAGVHTDEAVPPEDSPARSPAGSPARPGPGASHPARPPGVCEAVWAALPLEVQRELVGSSQAQQQKQRKRPRPRGGPVGSSAKRPSLRGAAVAKSRPAARRGTAQPRGGGRRQPSVGLLGYFATGADL